MNVDDFDIEDLEDNSNNKKKRNSTVKGKTAERELCKILTKKFGQEFTRTIGSGNRWSQISNMPEHAKKTFTGDICTPEGFLFSLECKNGYEDKIDLGNLFSSDNKTLDKFVKQSIKESKDCNRLPLICWKRKRKSWVALLPSEYLKKYKFKTYLIYKDWMCVDLNSLLELDRKFFFEND